ncbi:MAG: glycosyl hydrolase family 18 protein [Gemmatimonadetes bacterium]|nr:glycosyl hydrolase family 18 protein [Gemmatimonadota bacterium]MDA1102234.1 glycosyl hydrolase family 18 protein [Gemmatimonadota bacterium]
MRKTKVSKLVASQTLAFLLVACASVGPSPRVELPTTSDRFFVAGYHPYWAGDSWSTYPLDVLDELYFFELEAGADGAIMDAHGWPDRWRPMVSAAVGAGVQVVPTISIHDADAFRALFSDAARVDRLTGAILGVLGSTPGLSGIHLDFEVFQTVDVSVREGFTAFVAQLSRKMRDTDPSLSLSVFTLAFDDDDVYNERALGQIADFLVVQGYDFYSAGSAQAGPVGAVSGWGRLNWGTVVDRFEAFGVPARKLVMGVPLYGYEWPVTSGEMGADVRTTGRTIPYSAEAEVLPELPRALERATTYGKLRDPMSGSPYYTFQTDDGWHQGWFEDAESLRAKYAFVRARGLGGIALFPLAYGTDELWNDLRRAFVRPR